MSVSNYFAKLDFEDFKNLASLEYSSKLEKLDTMAEPILVECFKPFVGSYYALVNKDTGKTYPHIQCKTCNQYFQMYKWSESQNRIYRNSNSNILKHAKCRNKDQALLADFNKETLTAQLRTTFGRIYAKFLITHPTVSFLSGIEIMNDIANEVSNVVTRYKKNFDFNISRQYVTELVGQLGREKQQESIKFFQKFAESTSLVIDHWTNSGTNYIGVVANSVDQNLKIHRYVLAFEVASTDKSGHGIYENVLKIIQIVLKVKIPVISDNCPSMVVAWDGRKNQSGRDEFYKVYCLEHILCKIEEKLHKSQFFKDFNSNLNKLDAFFNHRHEKFMLELKPLNTLSTTRPWRSRTEQVKITARNYHEYADIKLNNNDFPDLPDYSKLILVQKFQTTFVEAFDHLESNSADLNTGLNVYFMLYDLSHGQEFQEFGEFFRNLLKQYLFPHCFTEISKIFAYLSRKNLEGNSSFKKKLFKLTGPISYQV